jgi:rhamnulokinase
MFVYGTRRWNIYRLYEEIINGLIKYVNRFGNELESVGIDTWGVDYGFLSKDGTLLEIPYQYRDIRTSGTDKILNKSMGNKEIYDITGIQFMTINSLNQMVAVKRDAPKMLEKVDRMLFIGDVLHYLLCGKMAAEFTVASTSQMLDAVKKDWSSEIFNTFGFPEKIKPKIIFAGDMLGYLDKEIAQEVGLKDTVKIIVPAVHDTASAATSVPAKGDDWAYISSGTWCMVGLETDQPVINDASYQMNISNSGGSLGKNLFLKNVMGLWIIQQCKKAWNRSQAELDYPEIVEKAIKAAPFSGFIDPDDELFFAPADNIEAIKNYFDKTGQSGVDISDIGTVARIVYESLAFKYRYVVDRLKATTKKDVNVLHIIGGGAKNKLLNQFTANALGMKVITGPVEATATGNLLLQAYGCGALKSLAEIREVVRNSNDFDVYIPESSVRDRWEAAFAEYKKICLL